MNDTLPDPEAPASVRGFFALYPDEATHTFLADRVSQLRDRSWSHLVTWTSPDQWHLTLHFVPALPVDRRQTLAGSAGAALEGFGPLTLETGDVSFFPRISRARALAVRIAPSPRLRELRQRLQKVLASLQISADESKHFRPHITLGRLKQGFPRVNSLRLRRQQVSWNATRVLLMESHLSPRGASHSEIAALPLG
jgi:2'-5' RNA ligase